MAENQEGDLFGSSEDFISSGAVLSLFPGSADLLWAFGDGGEGGVGWGWECVYGGGGSEVVSLFLPPPTSLVGPFSASHRRKMQMSWRVTVKAD